MDIKQKAILESYISIINEQETPDNQGLTKKILDVINNVRKQLTNIKDFVRGNNPLEAVKAKTEEALDAVIKDKEKAQKLYQKVYNSVKEKIQAHPYIVGFIACGLVAATIIVILKKSDTVEEAVSYFDDDVFIDTIIEESLAENTVNSIFDKLYNAWKAAEQIADKVGDEIKKKIAQTIATLILIGIVVLVYTVMAKPIAKLLLFIDGKLMNKTDDELKKEFCDSAKPVGRTFFVFVATGNVIFGILKMNTAFGDKNLTFGTYLKEKICEQGK